MEKDNELAHGYKIASKGKRFAATLVEGTIFMTALMLVYLMFGKSPQEFWSEFNENFEWIDLLYSLITGIVIGSTFYPYYSGNLGHKIFKLKVISLETGEDCKKPMDGMKRECLKHLLGYLIIPSVWILWDNKNQNLYDKLVQTVVVESESNK